MHLLCILMREARRVQCSCAPARCDCASVACRSIEGATVGRGARDMPPERGGRADETRPERMSGPIASLIYIKQCSGKRNIAWMRHSDA
ncbi:hypothetical protein X992_4905 [Burkholderia pseudomallei MSHR5492]|nr:hypothetical protein X992_4905 [Burkholderia pseudomallei MSHR5492]